MSDGFLDGIETLDNPRFFIKKGGSGWIQGEPLVRKCDVERRLQERLSIIKSWIKENTSSSGNYRYYRPEDLIEKINDVFGVAKGDEVKEIIKPPSSLASQEPPKCPRCGKPMRNYECDKCHLLMVGKKEVGKR